MIARITVIAGCVLGLICFYGCSDVIGREGIGGGGGTPGAEYQEDFESLDQASDTALGDGGWMIFGNVTEPNGTYVVGYGAFPAPNNILSFSGIALNQGGPEQGQQQLVIISDYNNVEDQNAGNRVEANTFRERDVVQDDVGKTVTFSFDAKQGNINDLANPGCTETPVPPCDSTALAFLKTLDPADEFAVTNFASQPMTAISETWMRYEISLFIDAGLVGHKLQYGFSATASNFEPSGVFYDNILVFTVQAP
ncbi:MAG: hypothetical protein HKN10_06820 [Myxococcales bacterium]|nr:hypothetical protein [Myxococcales bacterium]